MNRKEYLKMIKNSKSISEDVKSKSISILSLYSDENIFIDEIDEMIYHIEEDDLLKLYEIFYVLEDITI